MVLTSAPFCFAANPIELENAKPGTTAWQLASPALQHEIEGYASLTSVDRGGQINLFVSTKEPSFALEVYRMGWYGGLGARQVLPRTVVPGTPQPLPIIQATNGYLVECVWTNPYVLTVPNNRSDPTNWCSGIYLAKLTASSSGKQSYIVFTVRDDSRPSDYLFQSSVTTWQAYNTWGGYSLYPHTLVACWSQPAQKVSFNRPYERNSQYPGVEFSIGSGQLFTCLFPYTTDYCSPTAQGLSAASWEYNMLRFLERENYDVTYCTDVDVHENGSLLLSHKAFLSVGHDEYWSLMMRNNVEAARDHGINLGFFSANTCYWQIRFEPSTVGAQANRTMVCYKDRNTDPLGPDSPLTTVQWGSEPVNRPENKLIGVMYDVFPAHDDMVITNSFHWIYAGTGLKDGDVLPDLVGYEADRSFPELGPTGLQILAHSRTPESTLGPYSEMSLYRAPSGAFVFAAGSLQWAWGLDDYNADPNFGPMLRRSCFSTAAQQITRNVLAEFVKPTPVLTWATPVAITYGSALSNNQLNASANVPGSFAFSPGFGTVLSAGPNQILNVTFTPDDTTNYGSLSAFVRIKVKPASLTVTASNATRLFGAPNPPFTGSIAGLQNGDPITATYLCDATSSSPVGSYKIIPTFNDPAGKLSNYGVSIVPGTLDVTLAPNSPLTAQVSGQTLLLSLQTVTGTHYLLETTPSLSDKIWQVVQTNVGDGNVMTFTTQLNTNGTSFYRTVVQ